jgi:hypothetical protein
LELEHTPQIIKMTTLFTTSVGEGVYRLYNTYSTNPVLTMDPPADSTGIAVVTAQNEYPTSANANQQWQVKPIPGSKSYTLFNLGQGLYLSPNGEGLRGRRKPVAFRLRQRDGQNNYGIMWFPTRYQVAWAGSGVEARWYQFTSPVYGSWNFRRANGPAKIPQPRPLVGVPSVIPGTYRIVNAHTRTYLTQQSTAAGSEKYPYVVGSKFMSESPTQEWKITLHAETQTYWIQNVGTKRWLSTQDDSLVDSSPFYFTGVDNDIGPVHWDLRQGEWDGEFYIQLPGGRTAVARLNGASAADNTNITLSTRLATSSAATSYDAWALEPVNGTPDPTSVQPLPYGGPLKIGSYKIRNVQTRTLLTQLGTIGTGLAHISDPFVTGSAEISTNDFQKWTVFFIKESQQYIFQNIGSKRFLSLLYSSYSPDVITSSKVRSWAVLQSEEADEFILHIPGSNQAIWILNANATTGIPTSVITRINTGASYYKAQRWVFEPIDREGKDLVDPNTLKYPSILGPGTSGGGNDGGTASATDASSKAFVATLRDNGAAFQDKTATNITNLFAAATALSIKNQAISLEAIGSPRQKWEILPSPDYPGEYYFQDPDGGLILGHPRSIKPDNTPIVTPDTGDNRWRILSPTGTGSDALIVHPSTGLALYVDSQNNGAPVTIQYASDDNKFKWRFNGVK